MHDAGSKSRLAARNERRQPIDQVRTTASGRDAERRLVERDLLLTADLVGKLLPRRRDAVGAGLRTDLAGIDLRQLVLGDAVVLEDAGDARLDRAVRVVVGIGLGVQVRRDERLVVAGGDPLVDVEVAVPIGLEAGWIGSGPQRQVLAAEMRGGAPRRLLLLR